MMNNHQKAEDLLLQLVDLFENRNYRYFHKKLEYLAELIEIGLNEKAKK